LKQVDLIVAIRFASWPERGEVGGIGTFGYFIACANAPCEFHTTALDSTFLLLNSTFNVFAITTLVPILDSIM